MLCPSSLCGLTVELWDEQQATAAHPCDKQAKATATLWLQKAIDCCSIKQKWDCHSLRWRLENCLIWFSIAIWVFGSYFTVVITKGNEVCFVMLPGAFLSIITLMNSPPEQTLTGWSANWFYDTNTELKNHHSVEAASLDLARWWAVLIQTFRWMIQTIFKINKILLDHENHILI